LRRKFGAELANPSSWRFCGIGPHLLTVIPLGEVKVDLNAFNVKFADKFLMLELQKVPTFVKTYCKSFISSYRTYCNKLHDVLMYILTILDKKSGHGTPWLYLKIQTI
jgi:hypothetical protein